ncbi:polysaccharide lyase family 7 protein [Nevskia ramosa]|uniref:polysaccharide lyase family 7 protein n=1 Tax=Nevskia ramosa TaxID=64002 RepID=UPI00146C8EDD|nr:polysaccharide lyase family 7 protein [Nevskia ramosa]
MKIHSLSLPLAAIALLFSSTVGAATATSTAPKLMIDLSKFKLTLPVNSTGGITGKAVDVKPTELTGTPGYASKYFYTDTTGAVVFYSPANGATTSPGEGSDHTRSELREIYTGAGTTEWTNAVGGTMTASLRVDQVADKSGKAIIGQIHGLSSMMILVYYNVPKKTIEVRYFTSPDNKTSQTFVAASNVNLGAKINYKIQWIGSSVSVMVNGSTFNKVTPAAWNKVPVYFKAGAYSSTSNVGNPDSAATQVCFYSLNIQH